MTQILRKANAPIPALAFAAVLRVMANPMKLCVLPFWAGSAAAAPPRKLGRRRGQRSVHLAARGLARQVVWQVVAFRHDSPRAKPEP